MSSIIGKNIQVSLFGESHSAAIGVVIDRLPAGFAPDMDAVAAFLARRRPGGKAYATARNEADTPEILSGLVDGHTTGTPLAAVIRNADTRSKDYSQLRDLPRPAHADYPMAVKTGGANDIRGGGHSSGRLTAPLCFAGALALQYLATRGVSVSSRIVAIGGREVSGETDATGLDAAARETIEAARREGDSVGGIVECVVTGLPAGYGAPIFDGVENRVAAIVFGIPAVKGIEFGSGFAGSALRGSENNDAFFHDADGAVRTRTNNHGGILGGITSGMPLVFRAAIKPTPSIAKPQQSVNLATGRNSELVVRGRHDACIVPRARPVIEAAAALASLDLLLDPPPRQVPPNNLTNGFAPA
jgi:chorismate synthase